MLLKEICLIESVSFEIGIWDNTSNRYDIKTNKVEKDCEACEGTGKDEYYPNDMCEYCKGSGKYETLQSTFGSLDVSNQNAVSIIKDLLGLQPYSDDGLVGEIDKKDLANIKRRLIGIKNRDKTQYTKEPEKIERRFSNNEKSGIANIGRSFIYDMGRSEDQISRYVDTLINMIDVAQKNNGTIFWA